MEECNLSDIELEVMIIRMLNSMKKNIKTTKKDELEMKNVVSEIKNTLGGINRLDEAEV